MRILTKGFWATLVLSSMALGGCATTDLEVEDRRTSPDPLEQTLRELQQLSIEARDELRLLSLNTQRNARRGLSQEEQEQLFFETTYIPERFDRVVDFNYSNTGPRVIEALAAIADYDFVELGRRPAEPPHVHLRIRDQALITALRESITQIGHNVRIEVLESRRLIRYININDT